MKLAQRRLKSLADVTIKIMDKHGKKPLPKVLQEMLDYCKELRKQAMMMSDEETIEHIDYFRQMRDNLDKLLARKVAGELTLFKQKGGQMGHS